MKFAVIFLALILTGCQTYRGNGQYNREPPQDPDCWRKYGAAIGYCGKYPDR